MKARMWRERPAPTKNPAHEGPGGYVSTVSHGYVWIGGDAVTAPFETVVDAVAVHRIVALVQEDEIPVGAIREKLLDRYGDKTLAALLTCPWCLSIHVAAAVVVTRRLFPRAWPIAARVLAYSAAAGHLAKVADR